jgi:tetratricopeptide (TPR) repeat protein
VQARVRLAEVLMTEQRFDEAKVQLDVLRQGLPGNVAVERMYARLLAQRPNELRAQYAKYAEETREQRVVKLGAAGQLGDAAEVLRLSKLMLASDPGDVDAVDVYVRTIARQDRDAAGAALDAALKAKPDEPRLVALQSALAATTPEEVNALVEANVEKLPPYEKEIARAELLRRQNKIDEAVALLRQAQAIKPDEQRAYEIEFNLLVAQGKFDEAGKTVDALGRVNADQTFGELTRARLNVARAASLTRRGAHERPSPPRSTRRPA